MTMTTTGGGIRGTWEAFERTAAPGRTREIRQEGFRRFERLGFPTLKHEDWRFTDVSSLAATPFTMAEAPTRRPETDRWTFAGLPGPRLVFVNGRYDAGLSSPAALPGGAVACTLAEAHRTHAKLVDAHLDRLAGEEEEAFSALNSAFLADGAFLHVPDGVDAGGTPVHVLFLAVPGATPSMTHPRLLVVVGAGASAKIVEDHVTIGDSRSFTNPVTEFFLADGAVGHHYHLGRGSENAWRISSVYIEQGAGTDFQQHSVLLGGALVRNNVLPHLRGEDSESLLNGLYVPRGTQHHDNRMRVRHGEPNCRSRQYYRGVLEDSARAMFTGRIIVDPGAQKTDAVQSNKNLLLSDLALVETKPQLEIYADDVKCTHGATIGQIDEESIFYCRSRGIPEDQARRLLISAFANEILERMDLEPVRGAIRAAVDARLVHRGGRTA